MAGGGVARSRLRARAQHKSGFQPHDARPATSRGIAWHPAGASSRSSRAAPVVGDRPVRRSDHPLRADAPSRVVRMKSSRARTLPAAPRRRRRWTAARVHQGLHSARDETVVHEDTPRDVEAGILTLQIAGAVAGHAMTQGEGPARAPVPGSDRLAQSQVRRVRVAASSARRDCARPRRAAGRRIVTRLHYPSRCLCDTKVFTNWRPVSQ